MSRASFAQAVLLNWNVRINWTENSRSWSAIDIANDGLPPTIVNTIMQFLVIPRWKCIQLLWWQTLFFLRGLLIKNGRQIKDGKMAMTVPMVPRILVMGKQPTAQVYVILNIQEPALTVKPTNQVKPRSWNWCAPMGTHTPVTDRTFQ